MAKKEKKLKETNDVEQVTVLNQEDINDGFVSILEMTDEEARYKNNFCCMVKNYETNAWKKIYCKEFIDCYLGVINSLLSSYGISNFTDKDKEYFKISNNEQGKSPKLLDCGKFIDTNSSNPRKLKILRDFVKRINELNNTKEDVLFNFNNYTSNETTPTAEEIEEDKDTNFLEEVFIEENDFKTIKALLERKKNIILQGAPGVGKTFAAKKIAYSMIGKEDENLIKIVQFHQNYSYEDFVEGYKPNKNGSFKLKNGVFKEFCKRAEQDYKNKYFFIIDEINRGNLSKIFGELLMLIEDTHRGEKINLAYSGEEFCVPENVYIIGMMNTADRSLAMIDYALRRRFSFFEMQPAFKNDKFKKMIEGKGNIMKVIEAIEKLNEEICKDASLGKGFCIGHSYFCNLTDDNEETLKNIINYEIAPMLKEYWFDDIKKYNAAIELLKNDNLQKHSN